jgi:NADPH2:quinone reductase
MHALMSTAPGGPETLEYREAPTPDPGRGEVRLRIHAAGVNFPDTLIIRDLYQFKPERPFAPGGEAAGVVEALGEGVTHLKEGQRVAASVGAFGAYATHAVCDANGVMPIPDEMGFETAAGFVMTYGTSYYALKDRARLQPGETLLVLGAAGGVGSAAVELGKAMGARVVAAVSSEEKAAFARDLGANETVTYPKALDREAQKALSKAFKDVTGGGADVLYDPVGGDYCEPALRAMAWEGRYLVVGFPAGIPSPPLNLTLLKSSQIMGVFWGAAVMRDPKANQANMGDIQAMIRDGKVRPRITASYPLEKGAEALRLVEERKVMGKVVLTMG